MRTGLRRMHSEGTLTTISTKYVPRSRKGSDTPEKRALKISPHPSTSVTRLTATAHPVVVLAATRGRLHGRTGSKSQSAEAAQLCPSQLELTVMLLRR
jgi:hypothetical protein